jgi:hypothetical protein
MDTNGSILIPWSNYSMIISLFYSILSSHLNLTSLKIGNSSPCWLISYICACHSSNFLTLEVSVILSGGCFSFNFNLKHFIVDDHVCTQIAHTSSTNLLRIGYGTRRCLQCRWDWFIISCLTKQNIGPRKSSWVHESNAKGSSHTCSCCKHDM